jgi:hypothetical protein
LRDKSFFDTRDGLHHVLAFLLVVDRSAPLELCDRAIGSEGHIEIAIGRGGLEEGDMAAVEQVKAAADKDLVSVRG